MCKLVQKIKHSATSELSVQKFKKLAKRGPQSLSPPTENKYRLNPLHALMFGTFNHSAIDTRLILDIYKNPEKASLQTPQARSLKKKPKQKKRIPQGRDQFRHFAMNFTRCVIITTIPLIFTKVNLANISGFSTIPYTIKDFQNTWKYLSFNIFFYILNCIHLCFKRRYANKPLQKQSCGVLISWSYFTNYEFDECWIENSDSFI